MSKELRLIAIFAAIRIAVILVGGYFMHGLDSKQLVTEVSTRVESTQNNIELNKENPIKVDVLHSFSGTMAISEKPVAEATLLAIEEINERGGMLGRQIQPIVVDGRSDWPTFANEAENNCNSTI